MHIHKHVNAHNPHFDTIFTCRSCLEKDSLGGWNTSGERITNFGVCSCSENAQVRWNSTLVKWGKERKKYQNLKDLSRLPKSQYNFILWKLVAQRWGPGQLKHAGFELQVTVVNPSQDKFPKVGNSVMVFAETHRR